MTCDMCGKPITHETKLEICQPRPSTGALCPVLWTCDCGRASGARTPDEWRAYAEANGLEYEG